MIKNKSWLLSQDLVIDRLKGNMNLSLGRPKKENKTPHLGWREYNSSQPEIVQYAFQSLRGYMFKTREQHQKEKDKFQGRLKKVTMKEMMEHCFFWVEWTTTCRLIFTWLLWSHTETMLLHMKKSTCMIQDQTMLNLSETRLPTRGGFAPVLHVHPKIWLPTLPNFRGILWEENSRGLLQKQAQVISTKKKGLTIFFKPRKKDLGSLLQSVLPLSLSSFLPLELEQEKSVCIHRALKVISSCFYG